MKTENHWLAEYETTHQHPTNIKIHKICVPAIFWSVTAILWALPTPGAFAQIPFLNWATVMSIPALIFYGSIGRLALMKMTVVLGVALCINHALASVNEKAMLWFAGVVFIVGWIAQFYGHKLEGKKPAFLDDILFLLIGPLWTLKR